MISGRHGNLLGSGHHVSWGLEGSGVGEMCCNITSVNIMNTITEAILMLTSLLYYILYGEHGMLLT